MTTQTVNTAVGKRRIDVKNKLIEIATGGMIAYISVQPKSIDGELYLMYMVNDNQGVPLTQQSHAKINRISEEQKAKNIKDQAIEIIQTEGYGY